MKAFIAVSLAVAVGIFAFAIAAGLLGSLPASLLIGAVTMPAMLPSSASLTASFT